MPREGFAGCKGRIGGALVLACATAALTGALSPRPATAAEPEPVTLPGTPLSVSIGPHGECQSGYAAHGTDFYSTRPGLGDCGFFLAFPDAGTGQPTLLRGTTWGFAGSAGPRLPEDGEGGMEYTPVTSFPVTGHGAPWDPYTQTTVFDVTAKEKAFAEVSETTTYVNGESQFSSTFKVKNVTRTRTRMYFRAIYAGDLFLGGDDFGTGLLGGNPAGVVGAISPESGVAGTLVEAGPPALPWSAYQEGCWNETPEVRCEGAAATDAGIWHIVRSSVEAPQAFNGTVDPTLIDTAVGVEWDQFRDAGLGPGEEAAFTIINRTQIPGTLQVSPGEQTLAQGQTEILNVALADLAQAPYAGRRVFYSVSGANPQSGSVTLDAAGRSQIAYVGARAGVDTIQLFVDLVGDGTAEGGDPSGDAQVTFLAPAPDPNSGFRVKSVRASADGTITAIIVPVQSGTATLAVTAPTARVAGAASRRPPKRACTRGQVRITGRCLPASTLSGMVRARGVAGVALRLSVRPSSKVRRALKKGRAVKLTAKLSYRSELGGATKVRSFVLTVKPPRHRRR